MIRNLLAVVVLSVGLVGCAGDVSTQDTGMKVVATTNILGELVSELVGEDGTVESLMGPGSDPHDFTPSAGQAASLRSADLVVANGLGLEAGMGQLLDSAVIDGVVVVEVAPHVDPIPFGDVSHVEEDHAHEEDGHAHGEEGHTHQSNDPHFALDPLRMAEAGDVVAAALAELEPAVDWGRRAGEFRSQMEALHGDIERELDSIPPERRKLVTNHDAFGYFADRYGFEVIGTVIPGGSTLAEPSASALSELAEVLRREEITAIFTETTASSALAEAVAAEVGEEVAVYQLYTDSLGPEGSGAETYEEMMRTNAATLASALGG